MSQIIFDDSTEVSGAGADVFGALLRGLGAALSGGWGNWVPDNGTVGPPADLGGSGFDAPVFNASLPAGAAGALSKGGVVMHNTYNVGSGVTRADVVSAVTQGQRATIAALTDATRRNQLALG